MFIFFHSTRLGWVQYVFTRQLFILYIWTFEGSFLVICPLTCLLFFCHSRHFPINWLSPGYLTNCHRGYYILLFFLLPSQDFKTVLDPSSSRQTWTLDSWIITDRNFLSREHLKKLSAVSKVNKLSNLQSQSAQYSKAPLVSASFTYVVLLMFQ